MTAVVLRLKPLWGFEHYSAEFPAGSSYREVLEVMAEPFFY